MMTTGGIHEPDPQAIQYRREDRHLAASSEYGERFASSDGIGIRVVDGKRQLAFDQAAATGTGFWRWTADSRFAIFRYQHPHGNAITYVFDALAWELVVATPGCRLLQGGSLLLWESCGEYPVALSPGESLFLMENGRLASLPGFQQADILAPWWEGNGQVCCADWSPDGASLAFVAFTKARTDYVLFLAQGDGTRARRVAAIEGFPRSLAWAANGETLTVETEGEPYTLDIRSGRLER